MNDHMPFHGMHSTPYHYRNTKGTSALADFATLTLRCAGQWHPGHAVRAMNDQQPFHGTHSVPYPCT